MTSFSILLSVGVKRIDFQDRLQGSQKLNLSTFLNVAVNTCYKKLIRE